MEIITSQINLQSLEAKSNYQRMKALCDELKCHLTSSLSQGEEAYVERNRERGKLLARDRVELLLDQDSAFLELMPLVGLGQPEMTLGGSMVAGIGTVSAKKCLISANVQTMKGGALNEMSLAKASRLDDIAQENRLSMIYLNESSGADLPQQAKIFNFGGRTFREITRRSKLGIPSITAVFGSSTAGGAYVPGMSDYVVMVKNHAKTYLAGPPLVKMAINEDVDDETLGGAEMHSMVSGLSDYLANDEIDALRIVRDIVAQLHCKKEIESPLRDIDGPLYDSEELLAVVSADIRIPFDIREIIARIVDGSRFFEFKPRYGETLVAGFSSLFGVKVGIVANNGVLFSSSANKGAQFIQLCNRQNIPLIFLQNTTGFMVGKEAEAGGIIKNGAKLINAVSNSTVPAITMIVGGSYGAGNYGMCGRAFAPRFLFSWPNARLAVMGPDQLVGVMEILQKQKSKKELVLDTKANDELRARIEMESSAYYCTSRAWDDGIIDPRDSRHVLGMCLSIIADNEIKGTKEFGVFRM